MKGRSLMKRIQTPDIRQELVTLKNQIDITETKMNFTNEPKLVDALSYELLSLRARLGYLIEVAKRC